MAEFIFRDMVDRSGLSDRISAYSMAATTEEIGNDMYPPAKRKLLEKGIPFSRRAARMMTRSDYSRYDYIIGMDEENLRDMKWICGGDPDRKISLLLDHTPHPRDVADPWYTRNFDATYSDLEEGCAALLKEISDSLL